MTIDEESVGGWTVWSKHVLLELTRLNQLIEKIRSDDAKDKEEILTKLSDIRDNLTKRLADVDSKLNTQDTLQKDQISLRNLLLGSIVVVFVTICSFVLLWGQTLEKVSNLQKDVNANTEQITINTKRLLVHLATDNVSDDERIDDISKEHQQTK